MVFSLCVAHRSHASACEINVKTFHSQYAQSILREQVNKTNQIDIEAIRDRKQNPFKMHKNLQLKTTTMATIFFSFLLAHTHSHTNNNIEKLITFFF